MVENIQPYEDHTCPKPDGGFCSCTTCREMAQLELDTLEGQRLLVEMANRHADLKSQNNKTHSLINKRMPPEILSAIFAYCLPTPRQLEYCLEFEHSVEFRPVEPGHICRHWRDVAWSTPGLWRQLFVVLHSKQLVGRASLLADLAREWLDRSGGLPLSLYIQMEENDAFYKEPHNFVPEDHPFLELVKRYSQRWQDLYLRMWTPCISHMGSYVDEIPLLRTFKHWPIGPVTDNTWWNIQIAPRRVDLAWLASSTPETTSRFFRNIDWRHLIEVIVDSLPWNNYIQILKSASRMTRFTINTPFGSQGRFLGASEVVHSNLQYFSVSGKHNKYLYDFISVLNFPLLTELYYDVGSADRPSRISQCHCPSIFLDRLRDLKSLSIQLSLSLESERYIDILRRWPSLNELVLIDRDKFHEEILFDSGIRTNYCGPNCSADGQPPNPLFSLLAATYANSTTTEPSKTFLPALQTLGYKALIDDPPWSAILSTFGPLSDISNSRRRPLNTLNIEFGYSAGSLPLPVARQLWVAKKAGIDITLKDDDWYYELDDTNVFTTVMEMHNLGPC